MASDQESLREAVRWSAAYEQAWDRTPGAYLEYGRVAWGRSRRLGMLKQGRVKAYLGVQHVDPGMAGWGIVDEAQCRFFASLFVDGDCLTLRTFPRIDYALHFLTGSLNQLDSG